MLENGFNFNFTNANVMSNIEASGIYWNECEVQNFVFLSYFDHKINTGGRKK